MSYKKQASESAAPTYTKEQLMGSKTLGLPQDAVAAVLENGASYTKDQAGGLVREFLNRRV